MKIKTIIFFSITLILFILVTSGVCMDVYTVNYKNYRIVNAKMQRFETDELSHDSLYYLLSFDIEQCNKVVSLSLGHPCLGPHVEGTAVDDIKKIKIVNAVNQNITSLFRGVDNVNYLHNDSVSDNVTTTSNITSLIKKLVTVDGRGFSVIDNKYIYSIPKTEKLPKKIILYFDKRKIEVKVNNKSYIFKSLNDR